MNRHIGVLARALALMAAAGITALIVSLQVADDATLNAQPATRIRATWQ